jgi:hypothetical protein
MQNIKMILQPVDFPELSLPVIHQAATLGASFLYNTLKNIASLHPTLAVKLQQQEKQDKPA